MPSLYSALKVRRLALATTSGSGRGGAGGSEAPVLPTAALWSASLRSASLRCAAAGKTGGEAGEAEDIPLFFTWIPILALLSNYDQEICLIHVGTEGLVRSDQETSEQRELEDFVRRGVRVKSLPELSEKDWASVEALI